jgi:hypothetical protein
MGYRLWLCLRSADRYFDHALSIDPNYALAHAGLADCYIRLNESGVPMTQEAVPHGRTAVMKALAIAEFRKVGETLDLATAAALGHALAKNGQTAEARIILSDLSQRAKQAYVPPYSIAILHAGLGEQSLALDWLERGFQDRSLRPLWLKLDPRLDSLRQQARFIRLIQGMGLSS